MCSLYSSSVGVINNSSTNKLCQEYSLMTSTGRRYFSSAPAKDFNENISSLLDKCSVTLWYNRSKEASSTGWLTAPQSMTTADTSSFTTKRSFGERPVYFPVMERIAPVELSIPSSLERIFSTKSKE